jgi:hypothetical protein
VVDGQGGDATALAGAAGAVKEDVLGVGEEQLFLPGVRRDALRAEDARGVEAEREDFPGVHVLILSREEEIFNKKRWVIGILVPFNVPIVRPAFGVATRASVLNGRRSSQSRAEITQRCQSKRQETPSRLFRLSTAAGSPIMSFSGKETRSSGWPFPCGQQWKVCWRGPARNWGLVIVLGGFGYSDRAGIILLGMPVILIEQELFSPALQSALSGRSENQ